MPESTIEDDVLEAGTRFDGHVTNGSHAELMKVMQKYGVKVHTVASGWQWGVLVRKGSAWVGVHYSPKHKRACINLIPCVTVWVSAPGGDAPGKDY